MDQTAIAIIKMNEGLPDSTDCNSAVCWGLECGLCPLNYDNYFDRPTLGDVRAEMRREQDEPPKEIDEDMKPQAPVDDVKSPSHYQVFEGLESIEVIARSMTVAEFRGFCMGNVLKYRLRAGKKSELATVEKDLSKADYYKELFAKHKDQCRDAS